MENKHSDIFIDYVSGLSQKEMERKYGLNYRTISRRSKQIMKILFSEWRSSSGVFVEEIRHLIDDIATDKMLCPLCHKPKSFWSDDNEN